MLLRHFQENTKNAETGASSIHTWEWSVQFCAWNHFKIKFIKPEYTNLLQFGVALGMKVHRSAKKKS
jgi:hypothetical protein